MADFVMKTGDSVPPLQVQLLNASGQPVDLTTAATVMLHVRLPGGAAPLIDAPAEILDAVNGYVRYVWPTPQTLLPGLYVGEFMTTYQDGTVETFPNNAYFTLDIVPDLA